jgi:hypothetical protein
MVERLYTRIQPETLFLPAPLVLRQLPLVAVKLVLRTKRLMCHKLRLVRVHCHQNAPIGDISRMLFVGANLHTKDLLATSKDAQKIVHHMDSACLAVVNAMMDGQAWIVQLSCVLIIVPIMVIVSMARASAGPLSAEMIAASAGVL